MFTERGDLSQYISLVIKSLFQVIYMKFIAGGKGHCHNIHVSFLETFLCATKIVLQQRRPNLCHCIIYDSNEKQCSNDQPGLNRARTCRDLDLSFKRLAAFRPQSDRTKLEQKQLNSGLINK